MKEDTITAGKFLKRMSLEHAVPMSVRKADRLNKLRNRCAYQRDRKQTGGINNSAKVPVSKEISVQTVFK